jgi:hypothetical protein
MTPEDRQKACDKIMAYAKGTVESYGGGAPEAVFALGFCHFSLHAALGISDGLSLDPCLMEIAKTVARHYPDVYKRTYEAFEALEATRQ